MMAYICRYFMLSSPLAGYLLVEDTKLGILATIIVVSVGALILKPEKKDEE